MKREGRKRNRKNFARSPTLNTIKMIEKFIASHGNRNRTDVWKNLPKKVMWQTYLTVLEYLESKKLIRKDGNGNIEYLEKFEEDELEKGKEEILKPKRIVLPSYVG